jgi:hypothetical protein
MLPILCIFLADFLITAAFCSCGDFAQLPGEQSVNRNQRCKLSASVCSGCETLEQRLPLAVITIQNSSAGKTPDALGYNLGHLMPGTNAADWFRYSGVSAAGQQRHQLACIS